MAQGVPGRLRPGFCLSFGTTRVVGRQPYSPAALYPRRNPWYSLSEAESTSGHTVLSGVPRKKFSVTPGTVRLVAQRLNHYATPHTSTHNLHTIYNVYKNCGSQPEDGFMKKAETCRYYDSGVVVKALRYKPAGRGFDSRWCQWNFSVT